MKNKVIIIVILMLGLISAVFSVDSLTCNVRTGSCQAPEVPFLYANNNFGDISGDPENVLSSNSATQWSPQYNKILCCKSNLGNGELNTTFVTGDSCSGTDKIVDLLHFTSNTNARIGIREINIDTFTPKPAEYIYNPDHYSQTLCVKIPDAFSSFNLLVSDRKNLDNLGYTCLFRTSGLINGLISACDSTFNGSKKYKYTIWGKLTENVNSMQCNDDCTSKLDNRVYALCGEKIYGCENVPESCNGALLNSWVNNGTSEIKCSSPWNEVRQEVFSSTEIEVSSNNPLCDNIIVKKFPVIVDSEVVNMRVYMCSN